MHPAVIQPNPYRPSVHPLERDSRPAGGNGTVVDDLVPDHRPVRPPDGLLQPGKSLLLQVSADIQQLLDLTGDTVDLNAFASVRQRRGAEVGQRPDARIPPSSYRYLKMLPAELLQEITLRAVGLGPADAGRPRTNGTAVGAEIHPEKRRLDEITFALDRHPGGRSDARRLREVCRALPAFFDAYRKLVSDVRAARPDLAPALEGWSRDLLRGALARSLAPPTGAGDNTGIVPGVYSELMALVQRPFETYLPELVARHDEYRRFSQSSALELLNEAVGRAVGSGVADARVPPDESVPPEMRRLADMAAVLRSLPRRRPDANLIHNARRLLHDFLTQLRWMAEDVRTRRPDLAPALAEWARQTAAPILQRVLQTPGIRESRYVMETGASADLAAPLRPPFAVHVLAIERVQQAQHLRQFVDSFPAFFQRMAASRTSGDTDKLRRGEIVIRCTEAELAENLQRVPAGRLTTYNEMGEGIPQANGLRYTYLAVDYPRRSDTTTLRKVWWEAPGRAAREIYVVERNGVHSYSPGEPLRWQPTGAPGSPTLNEDRADRWAAFLQQQSG